MSFKMKASTKIIAPSLIQETLLGELNKSIAIILPPHSTAKEGGDCLKITHPLTQFHPLFFTREEVRLRYLVETFD